MSDSGSVRTGEDPTKAVLSESALHKKELCDYVINVATGCRHACAQCYVPSTPQIRTRPEMLKEEAGVENPQREWGDYVLYRDSEEMAAKLESKLSNKRVWKQTRGGRGIVALSFSTDCYQDARSADATRACVETLIRHDMPVRILTRNPLLALQDLDLYERAAEQDLITVGTSIPSLNTDEVVALERRAPTPEARLHGLEQFSKAGIPVFVSMSPTYPTLDRSDFTEMLTAFRDRLPTLDVVFHEVINARGGNFGIAVDVTHDAHEHELADALDSITRDEVWREYALRHMRWSNEVADELDVPIHQWPGQDLVTATAGTPDEHEVRGEYMAPSPEDFPKVPGGLK